jgi:hypothetical protein
VRFALPDDPFDEGSRGLFLVHAMAAGVSVVPSESGGAEMRVLLPLQAKANGLALPNPPSPRSRAEDSPERP